MENEGSTHEVLAAIHDHYVAGVNEAITNGDDELAAELSSTYIDEVSALLSDGAVAA